MTEGSGGTGILAAASWNVHGFVGLDRRFDPRRSFRVLQSLAADVVALQEVHAVTPGGRAGPGLEALAAECGHRLLLGPTLLRHGADYGNALLTRLPVDGFTRRDLSVDGREPRGAIDARLRWGPHRVRVIATHLGLRPAERRAQVARLAGWVAEEDADDVTIVLGDFNEWGRGVQRLAPLADRVGPLSRCATFPAPWPWLALDRVAVRPASRLLDVGVAASPRARIASDHLPLRARIRPGPP